VLHTANTFMERSSDAGETTDTAVWMVSFWSSLGRGLLIRTFYLYRVLLREWTWDFSPGQYLTFWELTYHWQETKLNCCRVWVWTLVLHNAQPEGVSSQNSVLFRDLCHRFSEPLFSCMDVKCSSFAAVRADDADNSVGCARRKN
jgi:hypothetical protein